MLVLLHGEQITVDDTTSYSVDIPNDVVNKHANQPIALFIKVTDEKLTLTAEFDK